MEAVTSVGMECVEAVTSVGMECEGCDECEGCGVPCVWCEAAAVCH